MDGSSCIFVGESLEEREMDVFLVICMKRKVIGILHVSGYVLQFLEFESRLEGARCGDL